MFKYLSKFLYVFSGKRYLLLLLLFLFMVSSLVDTIGIALIGPFLRISLSPETVEEVPSLSWFYKSLNFGNHSEFILALGIALVIAFILKGTFYLMSKAFIFRVSLNQKRLLQLRLLRSFMGLPYEDSLNFNSADLLSMIVYEANQFTVMCANPFFEFWSNFLVIIALLFLMARTDGLLALTSFVVLLPVIVLFLFLSKKSKEWGKRASVANTEAIKAVNNGIGGLKESKLLGCESFFEEKMSFHTRAQVDADVRFGTTQFAPRAVVETFLMVLIVGMVCVFQFFLKRDMEVFISSLTVFAFSAIRLIPALSQLLNVISRLRNSSYVLDKFYRTLKEADQRIKISSVCSSDNNFESPKREEIQKEFERIDLDNITYRYPGSNSNALQNVSMTIDKGTSIAIIGKSGAGKTTLVDVILGLLEPQSGDILLDYDSIYDDVRVWQNLISYIPQSIYLMDASIEDNIAFGISKDLIDRERVRDILKIAQLDDFVADLPDGLDTFVGDRGVRLSGGQRQRIGIARALYHKKQILVLDEATAALDGDTEKLVSEAINSLAGDKTLIIIAHRMSTIEQCDLVYRMEGGRIITSGSYESVVADELRKASGS